MFPIKKSDVLPQSLFLSVLDDICRDWTLQNEGVYGDGDLSWGKQDESSLSYFQAATHVKYKILKDLRRPIRLCRIHCNGQTFGQGSKIHTDFDYEGYWTFVLFMHPNWNIQWGGEFMCYDPAKQTYEYVPCLPNTGVLIPSHWDHVGNSPNSHTSSLRMSLAFSYVEEDLWDSTMENFPHLRTFR